MISCSTTGADRFRCPTKWELWRQILALLPRGRAWQTHEAGAELIISSESSQAGRYEIGSTGLGTEPVVERLTVMQRYWAAYAEVLENLHARACALIEEFFCATFRETAPEWAVEYGYPDRCEPWDTLCDKVRAQGGSTCAYLAALASRNGWFVTCDDGCQTTARADCAIADYTPLCDCQPGQIVITIHRALSPAYVASVPFAADAAVADCTPPCEPAPDVVTCLIERYKPAHVKAIYKIV